MTVAWHAYDVRFRDDGGIEDKFLGPVAGVHAFMPDALGAAAVQFTRPHPSPNPDPARAAGAPFLVVRLEPPRAATDAGGSA